MMFPILQFDREHRHVHSKDYNVSKNCSKQSFTAHAFVSHFVSHVASNYRLSLTVSSNILEQKHFMLKYLKYLHLIVV